MTPEELQRMSDIELAKWQAGWQLNTSKYILADKEWDRRNMERQHQFNLELLERQKEFTKISVTVTVIATIVGAIVGAIITALF